MDIRDLIYLADIKEKQALAMLDFYIPKFVNDEIKEKELQEIIDSYCNNMADNFMETYKETLLDEQLNWQFRSHMQVKGADKPHSGHRFYEALYRKMNESIINNIENCDEQKI